MFLLKRRTNLAYLTLLTLTLCTLQGATWQKIEESGYAAESEGDFFPAEKLYRQALKEAKKVRHKPDGIVDNKPVKEVLIRLNYVLVMQSKFAEAEPIYNELLPLLRYIDKNNDIAKEARLALVVDELADAYGMRLNPQWREVLLKHSLALKHEIYGQQNIYLVKTLDALIQYYCQHKKYRQADQYLSCKLIIVKKHRPNDIGLLSSTLVYLTAVKMNEKDYKGAEKVCIEALNLATKTKGLKEVHVANCQRRLGWLAMKQGRFPQASTLINQAIAVHNTLSGKDRIVLGQDYFCLAELAEAQNKPKTAENYYRQTIALVKQFYSADSFELIIPFRCLAKVLMRNGKTAEARELNAQAAKLARISFGETGALFSTVCSS